MLCPLIRRTVASHVRATQINTSLGSSKTWFRIPPVSPNVQCFSAAPLSCFNTARPTCSTLDVLQQYKRKCVNQSSLYTICDINTNSCLIKPVVAPALQLTHYCSFSTGSVSQQLDTKSEAPKDDKPTLWVKVKTLAKDYWYVFFPVHFLSSCAWFGGFYLVVYSGVDVVQILENIGAGESIVNALKRYEHTGPLAVAFFIYELAKPIRYAATLGLTTAAIKILAARGIIKPFPKKERLQVMYNERKDEIKRVIRRPRRKLLLMYKNLKMKADDRTKNGKRKSPSPKP